MGDGAQGGRGRGGTYSVITGAVFDILGDLVACIASAWGKADKQQDKKGGAWIQLCHHLFTACPP